MTAIAAGQAKWQNLTMDYLVRQDESGYGVEIRETAVRSVFEHLLPPGPGNLEKTTDFAARLARGSVFADNLRELAEDFRTEQTLQAV